MAAPSRLVIMPSSREQLDFALGHRQESLGLDSTVADCQVAVVPLAHVPPGPDPLALS